MWRTQTAIRFLTFLKAVCFSTWKLIILCRNFIQLFCHHKYFFNSLSMEPLKQTVFYSKAYRFNNASQCFLFANSAESHRHDVTKTKSRCKRSMMLRWAEKCMPNHGVYSCFSPSSRDICRSTSCIYLTIFPSFLRQSLTSVNLLR